MINRLLLIAAIVATIILAYIVAQDLEVLEAEKEAFSNAELNLSVLVNEVNNLREEVNKASEAYVKMREAYNIKLWLLSRGIEPIDVKNNINIATVLVFYNDILYPNHTRPLLEKYFEKPVLEGINITYLQIYSPPNFNILREIFNKINQTRPYLHREYVVFLNQNKVLTLDLNIVLSDLEVYTKCLRYFILTA